MGGTEVGPGGAGEEWMPAEGIHWVSQMKGGGRVWILLYVVMILMYQLYVQSLRQHSPVPA